ncbi:putative uncharacterized protein [Bacteroides eggerthii CAG:109]|nr:putative uncharacterized protein [Bacteroides eggerthii CAG:109]
MKIYRNTASVILYGNGVVFVDSNFDVVAITGERFINRVVHNFVNQVMKSFDTNVADIHGRTLTYSFQTLQYLDVTGRVIVFAVYLFFFSHNLISLIVITKQK